MSSFANTEGGNGQNDTIDPKVQLDRCDARWSNGLCHFKAIFMARHKDQTAAPSSGQAAIR